jgi:cytochrome c peroxidase
MLRIIFVSLLSAVTLADNASQIGDERAVTHHFTEQDLTDASIDDIKRHGQLLFEAKFTTAEGAGRPMATGAEVPVKNKRAAQQAFTRTSGPEANSCKGCHNEPFSGGAGDFVTNVFASEGVVNADFTTLDKQFSNERGTSHLFGSGFIELLAREMSHDLQAQRTQALAKAKKIGKSVSQPLVTKGISFGSITVDEQGFIDVDKIEGVDFDLVVRPFSQKGVFTSLRQFSINAMNAHHGMQSTERFGDLWTHTADFDEDGFNNELTPEDITALVAFQATLPLPSVLPKKQQSYPEAVKRGERLFETSGCAGCHVQELPLNSLTFFEPGPFNNAGTSRTTDEVVKLEFSLSKQGLRKGKNNVWYVPVFSDLKRHVIADSETPYFGNERLGQRFIPNDVFITPRLWGVGSSAPYGHRGDVTTLREVILHHGGEAKTARVNFEKLEPLAQGQIIEFLKSLVITQGAEL